MVKPVSTATQNALNEKDNKDHTHTPEQVEGLNVVLNNKADKGPIIILKIFQN